MLSQHQLNRLWDELIGAETRSHYFGDLVRRYQRRQTVATFLSLIFSSGAFVLILLKLDVAWAAPAAALIAAGLSFYSLLAQNHKRSIDSADLHSRWGEIATECTHLWEGWFSDDAERNLREIEKHIADASKSSTAFPNNEKAMRRWMALVEAHHKEQTAA